MTALELFSCSGGMAEGFRRAGIVFDHVVDADQDACDSYAANLGHRPTQMDVRDLLAELRAGRSFGDVDLLVADPPCTPWSRAGKRQGLDDERDMLRTTVEIIRVVRPRSYLIGNVPGLEDANNWRDAVQPLIGGLRSDGYCVADYALLDAADYGVPQHRRRPWWFGHLDGPCLRWPEPTHGDWSTMRLDGRRPWMTCREALSVLTPGEWGRPCRLRYRSGRGVGTKARASRFDDSALVVGTSSLSDGNRLDLRDRHPASRLDAPSHAICAKPRGHGSSVLALREPDHNRPPAAPDNPHRTVTGVAGQALLDWPWDRPATTVQRDARIAPPGHHDEWSILSMPDAIMLSELAAAILQGFPSTWKFCGKTKKSRWSQIGQAMPPPLAEAVARQVAVRAAVADTHRGDQCA